MTESTHFKMVASAIDFIENNLLESIGVQDVCSLSPLSSWQFQRIFRAYLGDSIGNYIRGRRLCVAAMELQTKRPYSPIIDLALKFQFGSQEAFTRAFKSYFEMTPAEVRSRPLARLPLAKPKLDNAKIALIKSGIKKEPEIKFYGEKLFVGAPLVIDSPLGIEAESNGIVSTHWDHFDRMRHQIESRLRGFSYGFALSPMQNMSDESLVYLAAAEVTQASDVPSQMRVLELPKTQYAIFEVTGFLDCCNVTTDYIYGIWLPQSPFVRGDGPDFEFFNHKIYKRGDSSSISYYFIPIKSK